MSSESQLPRPSSATSTEISPALRRRLQASYVRGKKVRSQNRDHDYAHALFRECVALDPGNLMFVDAMLENLQAKHRSEKCRLRSAVRGQRALKKALRKNQWSQVLRLGIELLQDDPWHVPTLRGMAEACAQLRFNEVELLYLKQALDAKPKDTAVNRHCALSLARMGQFDQAMACWHRIDGQRVRGDKEARRMISQLTVEKIRYAGRPRGKGTPPQEVTKPMTNAAQPPEQPPGQPPEQRRKGWSPRIALNSQQRLERRISDDPMSSS